MLYSDIDDTLIGWGSYNQDPDELGLERTRSVVQTERPHLESTLSTSRGLTEIQRLAPLMRRYPLDVLGANNGQQLFFNHDQRPADEWLLSLTAADADPTWQAAVSQRSGWELGAVMLTMKEILAEEGFTPAPRMEPPLETLVNYQKTVDTAEGPLQVLFSHYPDQPSFAIRNPDGALTPGHGAFGERFLERLSERLAERGTRLETRHFPYPGQQIIYLLEPEGIDKQAMLEHLLPRYPSVTSVITAGDNSNDPHLYPDEVEGRLNYRILAGDRESMQRKLDGKPRVLRRPSGDIGPAIGQHLQTIESFAGAPTACEA